MRTNEQLRQLYADLQKRITLAEQWGVIPGETLARKGLRRSIETIFTHYMAHRARVPRRIVPGQNEAIYRRFIGELNMAIKSYERAGEGLPTLPGQDRYIGEV